MFKHISPSPFYPRRDYEITANRERDVNKKICIHENNMIFINLFESSLRGAFFESISSIFNQQSVFRFKCKLDVFEHAFDSLNYMHEYEIVNLYLCLRIAFQNYPIFSISYLI